MAISRRIFLRNSAIAMAGVGSAPLWLERAAFAGEQQGARKKVLVAIFQRGAADGLNIVVPHGEQRYYDLRPTISIPRPSSSIAAEDSVDRSRRLLRSASLARVAEASVAAAAPRDRSCRRLARSHALALRCAGLHGIGHAGPEGHHRRMAESRAAAATGKAFPGARRQPRTHAAAHPARRAERDRRRKSEQLHGARCRARRRCCSPCTPASSDQVLNGTGRETFEAVALLQSIQKTPYQPAAGANYPRGRFGDSMRQIAQLIKADVGVEVAFADIGGWDHHVNEVGPKASVGQLANVLSEFGNSLAAFYQDLGDRMEDVVVVTMSEFGRTAKENGNRGTDHGHANAMFVMGGPVQGGKVYGKWPGLAPEQLNEERDLALDHRLPRRAERSRLFASGQSFDPVRFPELQWQARRSSAAS